jgi:hypothetical protein
VRESNDHGRSASGEALRLVCLHIFESEFDGSRRTRASRCSYSEVGSSVVVKAVLGCSWGLSYYTTGDWRKLLRRSEVFSKNGISEEGLTCH